MMTLKNFFHGKSKRKANENMKKAIKMRFVSKDLVVQVDQTFCLGTGHKKNLDHFKS